MSIEKQGTVQGYATSRNGKPTVTIDGQLYYLGKTQLTAEVGERISFEAKAFGERGDLWGINKWGKLPSNGSQQMETRPPAPLHPYTADPIPTVASDDATLRFISNCVGQAIKAKTITDPTDIEIWVSAARNALKSQR